MTELTVTGVGAVGELQPGWSVTEQATAVAIGESDGSVGAAKVSADRTSTSEFVGGNAIELEHPDLGTWNGKVTNVGASGLSAALDAAGVSRSLVATVTAKPFLYGTDMVSWTARGKFPLYTLDSQGNFYVWVAGTLTKHSPDGVLEATLATGLTGMAALVVDPTDQFIYYVRLTGTNRIQKLTIDGVFVTEWATVGSANGQVGAINQGIAVSSTNHIFVAEYTNSRVQVFQPGATSGDPHTYLTKWGTAGAGDGQFTQLVDLDVGSDGSVWTVEGSNKRVQRFTASGTFVSKFTLPVDFGAGVAVDDSSVYTALYDVNGGVGTYSVGKFSYAGVLQAEWVGGTSTTDGPNIRVFRESVIYVASDTKGKSWSILRTPASDNLEGAFRYLLLLADPTLDMVYEATTNPTVNLPGWTGDIWSRIKDLCSAYGVKWSVVDGMFTVRDVGSSSLTISNNTPVALTAASQGGSRNLAIKHQNTVAGEDLTMYTATAIQTVQILETRSVTFQTTSHPLTLNAPAPTDALTATPGTYHVQDSAGLSVPAASWTYYGGSVTPALGDVPGQIRITFQGPRGIIPGYTAPFSLASGTGDTRTPQLIITGTGVTVDPQTIIVGTGADPEQAATTIGATIDNFAISTPAQAYSRGSWAQTLATGTDTIITFGMDVNRLAGFGLDIGTLIPYNDSFYRITDIVYGNVQASVTAHRHVTIGDVKTALGGTTLLGTNLATNPSYETGATGVIVRTASSGTYTYGTTATTPYVGSLSGRITATVASSGPTVFDINPAINLITGDTYHYTLRVRPSFTFTIRPRLVAFTGPNGTGTPSNIDGSDISCPADVWTQLTPLTGTLGASIKSVIPAIRPGGVFESFILNGTVDLDAVLVSKDGGTTYFSGSTTAAGEIYNWMGTANASPSRRWSGTWTNGMVKALWAGYTNADVKVKPLRTS